MRTDLPDIAASGNGKAARCDYISHLDSYGDLLIIYYRSFSATRGAFPLAT
jgi:hypothetical protein